MENTDWDLEDLSNPKKFQDPLDVSGYENEFLINLLKTMVIIRTTEDKLAEERKKGVIGGPVHLSAGQEGIAAGICVNLRTKDRIFGAHRSHAHILALEHCYYSLFAEVLGKDTGLSRGMGGSMHLINKEVGFYGSVPIVAGTVSLAVGASFDALRNKKKDIGVIFLGDGAMEEGVVHESLNLAKILNTPTLFVVENNLFSSHLHMSYRQPKMSTSRFAASNDIEHVVIDGNNVLEVYEASKSLVNKCRKKEGPKFIEAITFRHYGHVDWRKDIDVGVNRSKRDLDEWMKRDPIKRLLNGMQDSSVIKNTDYVKLVTEIEEDVSKAWKKALKDPYPKEKELLDRVYFKHES